MLVLDGREGNMPVLDGQAPGQYYPLNPINTFQPLSRLNIIHQTLRGPCDISELPLMFGGAEVRVHG